MDENDREGLSVFAFIWGLLLTLFLMIAIPITAIEIIWLEPSVTAEFKQCEVTLENYENLYTNEIVGYEAATQKEIPLENEEDLIHCRKILNNKELYVATIWFIIIFVLALLITATLSCFGVYYKFK